MVAFNFKARFVPKIIDGSKVQTIRNNRKRNSRIGDELQLFHGPRMAPKRIGGAQCIDCGPLVINFNHDKIMIDWSNAGTRFLFGASMLDGFAVQDGFDDFADMRAFWNEVHAVIEFQGWITSWADTFQAVQP